MTLQTLYWQWTVGNKRKNRDVYLTFLQKQAVQARKDFHDGHINKNAEKNK